MYVCPSTCDDSRRRAMLLSIPPFLHPLFCLPTQQNERCRTSIGLFLSCFLFADGWRHYSQIYIGYRERESWPPFVPAQTDVGDYQRLFTLYTKEQCKLNIHAIMIYWTHSILSSYLLSSMKYWFTFIFHSIIVSVFFNCNFPIN